MSKVKDRQLIFEKYNGHCAYCGCELKKGWHMDHAYPVERKMKNIGGHYIFKSTGEKVPNMYNEDIDFKDIQHVPNKLVPDGFRKPENDTIENMMPSCPSCNINKHSMNIEEFRAFITRFVTSLNKNNTQYRIAKKYGLIQETGKQVMFYFENFPSEIKLS